MSIDAWTWHLTCNFVEIPLKMRYFNEIFIRKNYNQLKIGGVQRFFKVVLILDILIGRTLYDHLDGPNTLRSFWWAEYFTIILIGRTLYDHFDWPNRMKGLLLCIGLTVIQNVHPLTQNILQHLVNQLLFTRTRNNLF